MEDDYKEESRCVSVRRAARTIAVLIPAGRRHTVGCPVGLAGFVRRCIKDAEIRKALRDGSPRVPQYIAMQHDHGAKIECEFDLGWLGNHDSEETNYMLSEKGGPRCAERSNAIPHAVSYPT